MNTRKTHGGKDGQCVRLTTLPPSSCRMSRRSRSLNLLEPQELHQACRGKPLPFTRQGRWLTPRPGRFTPAKEIRYPLYRGLGGPQRRCGQVRKISPQLEFSFIRCFTIYTSSVIVSASWFSCILLFLVCTYNTQHKYPRSPTEFEPTIPANDRPQNLALNRSATGIGRIQSPDRPTRSESLYRLCYTGHSPSE